MSASVVSTYRIEEQTYWTGNGCDCCPKVEESVYFIYKDGIEMNTNGSMFYLEDAYKAILEDAGISVSIRFAYEQ